MSYSREYEVKLLRDFSRIRDSLKKCMQTLGSAPSKTSSKRVEVVSHVKATAPGAFEVLALVQRETSFMFFDKVISKTL